MRRSGKEWGLIRPFFNLSKLRKRNGDFDSVLFWPIKDAVPPFILLDGSHQRSRSRTRASPSVSPACTCRVGSGQSMTFLPHRLRNFRALNTGVPFPLVPLGLSRSQQVSPVKSSVSECLRDLGMDAASGGEIAECVLLLRLRRKMEQDSTARERSMSPRICRSPRSTWSRKKSMMTLIRYMYICSRKKSATHPRGQHVRGIRSGQEQVAELSLKLSKNQK